MKIQLILLLIISLILIVVSSWNLSIFVRLYNAFPKFVATGQMDSTKPMIPVTIISLLSSEKQFVLLCFGNTPLYTTAHVPYSWYKYKCCQTNISSDQCSGAQSVACSTVNLKVASLPLVPGYKRVIFGHYKMCMPAYIIIIYPN